MDRPQRPGGGEHAAEPEHHEPGDHVRGMEPNQGIERRPEEVRGDREAVAVDEAVPLAGGSREEDGAEQGGHEQPGSRAPDVAAPERASAEGDADAARQQADGPDHGDREHVVRIRPVHALSRIEEMGDDEHTEE